MDDSNSSEQSKTPTPAEAGLTPTPGTFEANVNQVPDQKPVEPAVGAQPTTVESPQQAPTVPEVTIPTPQPATETTVTPAEPVAQTAEIPPAPLMPNPEPVAIPAAETTLTTPLTSVTPGPEQSIPVASAETAPPLVMPNIEPTFSNPEPSFQATEPPITTPSPQFAQNAPLTPEQPQSKPGFMGRITGLFKGK